MLPVSMDELVRPSFVTVNFRVSLRQDDCTGLTHQENFLQTSMSNNGKAISSENHAPLPDHVVKHYASSG